MDSTLRRTWAEIDMDALAHNYETLRNIEKGTTAYYDGFTTTII